MRIHILHFFVLNYILFLNNYLLNWKLQKLHLILTNCGLNFSHSVLGIRWSSNGISLSFSKSRICSAKPKWRLPFIPNILTYDSKAQFLRENNFVVAMVDFTLFISQISITDSTKFLKNFHDAVNDNKRMKNLPRIGK